MAVRILPTDHCRIRLPLADRLIHKDIELIRHGPPDIVKRTEPVHNIFEVKILLFLCHMRKAPPVIGMKKNQICFDPHLPKALNILLDPRKISRVEAVEIPDFFRISHCCGDGTKFIARHCFQLFFVKISRAPGCIFTELEGIKLRLPEIVFIMLRENTEADLVEGQFFQTLIRVLAHLLLLQMPHIAGRAYRIVYGPVIIAEVILGSDTDRAMIPFFRVFHRYRNLLCLSPACLDRAQILFAERRHKPDPVESVSVIESGGRLRFGRAFKGAPDPLVSERISF